MPFQHKIRFLHLACFQVNCDKVKIMYFSVFVDHKYSRRPRFIKHHCLSWEILDVKRVALHLIVHSSLFIQTELRETSTPFN